jgi:hypothetical protein
MGSRRWMNAWLVTVMVRTLWSAAEVSAEPWKRAYVDALPDEAFAVVHVRSDGTRSRHLPHHDAVGRVDRPHLRSALARLGQVRWEDPADAERARRHLLAHQDALGGRRGRTPERSTGDARR